MAQLKNPMFAKCSTYSVLENALKDGGALQTADRAVYVICLDTDILYYIGMDKVIHSVKGGTAQQVKRVDALPEIGDTSTIYIVGTNIYTFDGEKFTSVTEELEKTFNTFRTNIGDTINTLMENIAELQTNYNALQRTVSALQDSMADKADKANTLAGYGITNAYTKDEVDELISETKGDTGEATISEFVETKTGETLDEAKRYVDEQIQLHITE